MKFKAIILLFFATIWLCPTSVSSQQQTLDSLKNELQKPVHDTTKMQLYFHIANIYMERDLDFDSVNFYADKAFSFAETHIPANASAPVTDSIVYLFIKYNAKVYYVKGYNYLNIGQLPEAISYFEKSVALNEFIENKEGIAENYTPLGICQYAQGDYDGAIEFFQKGLNIHLDLDDPERIASSYNNIGIIYRNQGLYDKAVENYLFSLKIYEEEGYVKGAASANMNIGIVLNEQENYDIALEYYFRALDLFKQLDAKRELNRLYNNIGLVYSNMAKDQLEKEKEEDYDGEILSKEYFDKALEYFNNSLFIAREINDKMAISANLSNIGSVYKDLELFHEALVPFLEALKIDREIGDVAGQAMIYNNLASLFNVFYLQIRNKGDDESLELKKDYLEKAVNYGEKSYNIALEIGSLPTQRSASKQLMDAYKYAGDKDQALHYAYIYIAANQMIFNEERSRALAEMQTKYEAEKKQLEIENLNKENALRVAELAQSEEQRKRQLAIIYSFVAGFIIIAVFSFIITRLFVEKKKANILLAKQKEEILEKNAMLVEANEEIRAQRDEIEAQHTMVVRQKEFIEIQKTRIDDSIRYAQRIQNAVLPTDDCIAPLFDDYFVLYQPKDVVSGDFYWTTSVDDWILIAAADCTGHGVPGAFMSMLGISFLNQIAVKSAFKNAADVLQELRDHVVTALKQSQNEDSQLDGMDISLAIINKKTLKCHFAGANNPLWIIRNDKDKLKTKDPEIIVEEIKGNKMPVGIFIRMDKYTNHELQLNKGDKLYLFSDGFVDQFGGPNQRKYNRKEFRKLLAETSSFSMKKQKETLNKNIYEWKNPEDGTSFDQIDDVVVFGIKI